MTTENIQIIVRDDGSREVARNIALIGVSARSSAVSIAELNAALATKNASVAAQQVTQLAVANTHAQKAVQGHGVAVAAQTKNLASHSKAVLNNASGYRSLAQTLHQSAGAFTLVGNPVGEATERMTRLTSSAGRLTPAMLGAGAAVGAFALIMEEAFKAGAAEEAELAKINAILDATGNAAGQTAEGINQLAHEIAGSTLSSISEIRNAASELLTFRSVAGETFTRTLKAAEDMSAVFGGSVADSAFKLGRALEDPARGMLTLRRSGIVFTQSQQEVIKALVATGNEAAAQGLILDKVESKFKGVGEKLATNTFAGAVHKVSVEFETMLEAIAKSTGIVGGVTSLFKLLANGLHNTSVFAKQLDGALTIIGDNKAVGFMGALLDRLLHYVILPLKIAVSGLAEAWNLFNLAIGNTPDAKVPELSTGGASEVIEKQLALLKELKAEGIDVGTTLAKEIFSTNEEGALAALKARAESESIAASDRLDREKELQLDIDKVVLAATSARLQAQLAMETQFANDRLGIINAVEEKKSLGRQSVQQTSNQEGVQRQNDAKLQTIAQGYDAENAVIRDNLAIQTALVLSSAEAQRVSTKKLADESLATKTANFEREKQLLQASVDEQLKVIEKQDAVSQAAKNSGVKEGINPQRDKDRLEAVGKIESLTQNILSLDLQIAATEKTDKIETANKLFAEQMKTDAEIYRIKQAEFELRVKEAGQLKGILSQYKTGLTVIKEQLAELRRYQDSLAATDIGATQEEFAAALRGMTTKLKEELDNQDKIVTEFSRGLADTIQQSFADYLYDPFDVGLKGLALSFANAVRKMATDAAAAKIFENLFGGKDAQGDATQGKFGKGGLANSIGGLFGQNNQQKAEAIVGGAKPTGTIFSPIYVKMVGGAGGAAGGADPLGLGALVPGLFGEKDTRGGATGGSGPLPGLGGGGKDDPWAAAGKAISGEISTGADATNKGFLSSLAGLYTGVTGTFGTLFTGLTDGLGGLFKSIGGLFSGGGGGGGGASGLSGLIATAASAYFGGAAANGGELGKGQFGLVGEKGPELIMGGTNGKRITPLKMVNKSGANSNDVLNQFAAMLAAQKPPTVVNINEQDPQALLSVMRTREGVKEQRNFVHADQRKINRTLGSR